MFAKALLPIAMATVKHGVGVCLSLHALYNHLCLFQASHVSRMSLLVPPDQVCLGHTFSMWQSSHSQNQHLQAHAWLLTCDLSSLPAFLLVASSEWQDSLRLIVY